MVLRLAIYKPIAEAAAEADILRDYEKLRDKKKIAKIYLMTVKEIDEILKNAGK